MTKFGLLRILDIIALVSFTGCLALSLLVHDNRTVLYVSLVIAFARLVSRGGQ